MISWDEALECEFERYNTQHESILHLCIKSELARFISKLKGILDNLSLPVSALTHLRLPRLKLVSNRLYGFV